MDTSEIFEASKKESHWPVCAWGASRNMLEAFSKSAGLRFERLCACISGKKLRMDLPGDKVEYLGAIKGLVTYDLDYLTGSVTFAED